MRVKGPPKTQPTYNGAKLILQIVVWLAETKEGLTRKEISEQLEINWRSADRYLSAIKEVFGPALEAYPERTGRGLKRRYKLTGKQGKAIAESYYA